MRVLVVPATSDTAVTGAKTSHRHEPEPRQSGHANHTHASARYSPTLDLSADIWSNSAWPARRPRGCSSARTCPCRRRRGGRRLALTAGLPRGGAGNRRSAAAANAVTKNGDGTVSVEINALHDAEGLERNLHQGDIPAVVRYLPPDQGRGRTRSRSSSQLGAATRSREAGRSRCAGTGVCASRSTKRSPAHCRTDRQRRTPRMAIDPGKVSCPDRYPACSGPRRRCAP
jgi:hypothetical protein